MLWAREPKLEGEHLIVLTVGLPFASGFPFVSEDSNSACLQEFLWGSSTFHVYGVRTAPGIHKPSLHCSLSGDLDESLYMSGCWLPSLSKAKRSELRGDCLIVPSNQAYCKSTGDPICSATYNLGKFHWLHCLPENVSFKHIHDSRQWS